MPETLLQLTLRETVRASDPDAVFRLTESCRIFYPEETEIARELVEERLAKGPASGYHFLFAETPDALMGYTCFGPVPMTLESFDLYWIAVRKDRQGTGIGRRLLQETERRIANLNGRRIYVETSSRSPYGPTHRFYLACGYRQAAILPDFYAPDDDKVIYLKVLPCP